MCCRHGLRMGILSRRFRATGGASVGSWRHIPPHCSGNATSDDSRRGFNILPQSIRIQTFWYCNVKLWRWTPGAELDRCLPRSRKFIVAMQSGHGGPLQMNGTPDPVRSGVPCGDVWSYQVTCNARPGSNKATLVTGARNGTGASGWGRGKAFDQGVGRFPVEACRRSSKCALYESARAYLSARDGSNLACHSFPVWREGRQGRLRGSATSAWGHYAAVEKVQERNSCHLRKMVWRYERCVWRQRPGRSLVTSRSCRRNPGG